MFTTYPSRPTVSRYVITQTLSFPFTTTVYLSSVLVQMLAEMMGEVSKHNPDSMVALHLPHVKVGEWFKGFEVDCQFQMWKSVKAPITIASSRPVGYSPSWANKPLSACQTFSLLKPYNTPRPFHNAFLKYSLCPKGDYRNLWSDCIVLPQAKYKKEKGEIQKKVQYTFTNTNRDIIYHHNMCTHERTQSWEVKIRCKTHTPSTTHTVCGGAFFHFKCVCAWCKTDHNFDHRTLCDVEWYELYRAFFACVSGDHTLCESVYGLYCVRICVCNGPSHVV